MRTAASTSRRFDIDKAPFNQKQWGGTFGGDLLIVRGSFADIENENIEPFGGTVARSRGAVQLRRDWSLAASPD